MECLGGNGYVEEHGLARVYSVTLRRGATMGGHGQCDGARRAAGDVAAAAGDGGAARGGRPGPGGRPAPGPGHGRGGRVPPGRFPGGPPRPRGRRGRRPLDGRTPGGRPAGLPAGPPRARRRSPRRSSRPGSAAAGGSCSAPSRSAAAARRRSSTAPCPAERPSPGIPRIALSRQEQGGPDRKNEALTVTLVGKSWKPGPAVPIPSARPSTAPGRTSPCSPRPPGAWSCA